VKLAYVTLGTQSLMPLVDVDETKLQDYFEEHRNEFIAEEERKIRHILIGEDAGDEAAQRAKAEELFVQLQGGADFAALAAEHSNDPGSATNGGDLGWVNRGVMVPPFEESAFSLEIGALSEPVKTDFGYHIIQVTETRGGSDATFEQMRSEVETAYRKFQAEELFYDYYERLANAAYENSDSLDPAAEALGLKVEYTDWITRTSPLPSVIDSPKVANAAFSEDVLTNGHNSDVIELEPTEAVVVRVKEHEAQTTQAFEDVREQVVAEAAAAQASDKAARKGSEAIEKLKAGQSLADVANANAWQHHAQQISRHQRGVPAEVVDAAFKVQPPEQAAKAFTGVVSAEGDYFVIAINGVEYGKVAEGASDGGAQAQRLLVDLGRAEFDGVLESLRSRASVEILSR
jgi:peptidyl-prolyl cis-trans isomerase D